MVNRADVANLTKKTDERTKIGSIFNDLYDCFNQADFHPRASSTEKEIGRQSVNWPMRF